MFNVIGTLFKSWFCVYKITNWCLVTAVWTLEGHSFWCLKFKLNFEWFTCWQSHLFNKKMEKTKLQFKKKKIKNNFKIWNKISIFFSFSHRCLYACRRNLLQEVCQLTDTTRGRYAQLQQNITAAVEKISPTTEYQTFIESNRYNACLCCYNFITIFGTL